MDLSMCNAASFFSPTVQLEHFNIASIRQDLADQQILCQMRGLNNACKWLGDLGVALSHESSCEESGSSTDYMKTVTSEYTEIAPYFSHYTLAKVYFDTKEYDRCAHLLTDITDKAIKEKKTKSKGVRLLYFLQMYAQYMSAEKKWHEDELDDRSCDKKIQRNKVIWIKRELESHLRSTNDPLMKDAFLLYLYGIVLKKLSLKEDAIEMLCKALHEDHNLWCAWFELSTLINRRDQLMNLKVPSNAWMKCFFEGRVYLDLYERERALELFIKLNEAGFQESINLKCDLAIAHDSMRNLEEATRQFKLVTDCDPYRLDGMDVYSNVLYVSQQNEELAHLAHHSVRVDKYRPQTCCIIGNFYSLRGQHDKAVLYFQRALKLRPAYSFVWILVGHEYMELRNVNAAVHSYRKAIEYNPRDYRSWYGLGQTYELLMMPSYTLYYYREALSLQPADSRILVAMGDTYEKLKKLDEAKKCFWRAYAVGDFEGNALIRLGKCYEESEEEDEAAAAYTQFIKLCNRNGIINGDDLGRSYLYLANYHLHRGHYDDASAAARKCLDYPETKEEGKAMFKQINATRMLHEGKSNKKDEPGQAEESVLKSATKSETTMLAPTRTYITRQSARLLQQSAPASDSIEEASSDMSVCSSSMQMDDS